MRNRTFWMQKERRFMRNRTFWMQNRVFSSAWVAQAFSFVLPLVFASLVFVSSFLLLLLCSPSTCDPFFPCGEHLISVKGVAKLNDEMDENCFSTQPEMLNTWGARCFSLPGGRPESFMRTARTVSRWSRCSISAYEFPALDAVVESRRRASCLGLLPFSTLSVLHIVAMHQGVPGALPKTGHP
jgi:hypothetical protein